MNNNTMEYNNLDNTSTGSVYVNKDLIGGLAGVGSIMAIIGILLLLITVLWIVGLCRMPNKGAYWWLTLGLGIFTPPIGQVMGSVGAFVPNIQNIIES